MNTPSNKNRPYFPLQFSSETSYEGIGTSDCTSFGYHAKRGKIAHDAEIKFRAEHPEIQNVARSNDLYSWLNNPTCTVDACVPLLKTFSEKYKCPMDELINIVQRCIIQTTVESAYRLYNVNETHRLFAEGLYDQSQKTMNEAIVPPPVWVDDSSKKIDNAPPLESSDQDSESKSKKPKTEEAVLSYSFDELFLDSVTKVHSFGKFNLSSLTKICKKVGIKKFSTMNKDTMLQELYKFKEMYNLYPYIRFKYFYTQEKCNATGCSKTKDLREVYGMQWRYCSYHQQCAQEDLKQWDRVLDTAFWDINNNRSLSIQESTAKFLNRTFADILSTTATECSDALPFPLVSTGLSKSLLYEKVQSKGTLRSNLMKGKSLLCSTKKTSSSKFSESMQPGSPLCSVDGDIDTFDTSSIKPNEDATEMECDLDIDLEDNDDDAENAEEEDENDIDEEEQFSDLDEDDARGDIQIKLKCDLVV